jgi:hypothetical protein
MKLMTYDNKKYTWERQPGEHTRAYYNFCLYRDYGIDRSVSKVFPQKIDRTGKIQKAQYLNGSIGEVESGTVCRKMAVKWSARFEWVKRVTDYDEHLEKDRRKKNIKKTLQFLDRQVKAGERIEKLRDTILTAKHNDLVRKIKKGGRLVAEDVQDFSANDIVRLSIEARDSQKLGLLISDDEDKKKEPLEFEPFEFTSEDDKRALADVINKINKK